ncbi:MAG: hypothetical protein M1837_000837 [Sclerophora amabilis]|nr:MAG: hypothetical protein M1837_000837 [Sclerophora amabilis]
MPPDSASSPPSRGGLGSLYANLLDSSGNSNKSSSPTTAASISRAPVVFKQGSEDEGQGDDASNKKQQINAAALRFQPTKRPQLSTQKAKPKPAIPKQSSSTPPAEDDAIAPVPAAAATSRPPVKSTLADWTTARGEEDVNGFYGGEKRQRGGRKKRKKNREEQAFTQDWDDIYDPSRPNSYEEYKHSDEKVREVRDWKDRLYAHRMVRRRSSDLDSEDDGPHRTAPINPRFAPPSNLSFAPPTFDSPDDTGSAPAPPLQPVMDIHQDRTGEDAFARRMRMSIQNQANASSPPLPPLPPPPPPVDPPPASDFPTYAPDIDANAPPPPPPLPPPPPPSDPPATISRAPVRYNFPSAPADIPASDTELAAALQQEEEEESTDQPVPPTPDDEEEAPRSIRPGQKGFAARLMSKYGWSKGTGLGASASGIVNPLRVQLEKQKKKSDAEGGGFVGPGGRGKIIGGQKKKPKKGEDDEDAADEEGMFGKMSEVVVMKGMVNGMDLDAEMEADQESGGLMQEIGEECGEKYGRVERVFIDRSSEEPKVFVKFTSQLSALRAVNALQGRIFNGNPIAARFFSTEAFEKGELGD